MRFIAWIKQYANFACRRIDGSKAGQVSVHPFRTNDRFVLSAVILSAVCSLLSRKYQMSHQFFALPPRREYPRNSFQPSKNFTVLLAKRRAYAVSCIVRRSGRSNTLIERIADSSRVGLRNFATGSLRPATRVRFEDKRRVLML